MGKKLALVVLLLSGMAQAQSFLPVEKCHFALKDYRNEVLEVFVGIDDQKEFACREAQASCTNELLRRSSYNRSYPQSLRCEYLRPFFPREKVCTTELRRGNGELLAVFKGEERDMAGACQEAAYLCKRELRQRHRQGRNHHAYCSAPIPAHSHHVVVTPVAVNATCDFSYSYMKGRTFSGRPIFETKVISAGANDLSYEAAKARACSFARATCENDSRLNNGGACFFSRAY